MVGRLERLERVRELRGLGCLQVVDRDPHRFAVAARQREGRQGHDGVRASASDQRGSEELGRVAVRRDRRGEVPIVDREGSTPPGRVEERRDVSLEVEHGERVEGRPAHPVVVAEEGGQARLDRRLRFGARDDVQRLRADQERWVLEPRGGERQRVARFGDAQPPNGREPHLGVGIREELEQAIGRLPRREERDSGRRGDRRIGVREERLDRPRRGRRPERLDRRTPDAGIGVAQRVLEHGGVVGRARPSEPADRVHPDDRVLVRGALHERPPDAPLAGGREQLDGQPSDVRVGVARRPDREGDRLTVGAGRDGSALERPPLEHASVVQLGARRPTPPCRSAGSATRSPR